jgi:hypothetical protein
VREPPVTALARVGHSNRSTSSSFAVARDRPRWQKDGAIGLGAGSDAGLVAVWELILWIDR